MNCKVNSFEYNQRSILKSIRQKNWLSIPSSTKQVTFQSTIPNDVRNLSKKENKKESTMGRAQKETRGLPSDKRCGMTLFIYTPEKFPEDAATQNIKTTKN